jgi:hypothetical protein
MLGFDSRHPLHSKTADFQRFQPFCFAGMSHCEPFWQQILAYNPTSEDRTVATGSASVATGSALTGKIHLQSLENGDF